MVIISRKTLSENFKLLGDKLEEMKENNPDGEADDDLADDVPDVADDNGADVDSESELADRMSRLSMMSS